MNRVPLTACCEALFSGRSAPFSAGEIVYTEEAPGS